MKKNRISAILFLAVILSVIIYSAYGMVNQGKDDDYISVSVIVNDSRNTRWNAFREGLEQAADAAAMIVSGEMAAAMNRFNMKKQR